jgi:hypothetical protein
MRSPPLADWPQADREAWTPAGCAEVRRRGGAAAHMEAVTQVDLERRYGYLLDQLKRRGLPDESAPAGGRVPPPGVAGFLGGNPICRPVTHAQSAYKLRRTAEVLAPGCDFSWLRYREGPCPCGSPTGRLRPHRHDRDVGRGWPNAGQRESTVRQVEFGTLQFRRPAP